MNRYRVATLVLVVLSLSRTAHAQTAPEFLAADVFGGLAALFRVTPIEDQTETSAAGWNVGGTVRFRRGVGLKGEVVRTNDGNDARQLQYVGGIEVATPFEGEFAVRSFAHALAGHIRNRSRDGVSGGSPELILGGGFDTLYLFRMQFDYVRMNIPGIPKNNGRFYLGGVLPLCFTGCRSDLEDGIPIHKP